ncbi:MAG: DUF3187 family protein [Geobacter sp.]|nr:MAG: DUF3187 family protein [Geobacter sp.]
MRKLASFAVVLFLAAVTASGVGAEPLAITPFYTFNQNPLVQIYGLPAAENAVVQPAGRGWGLLAFDVANSDVDNENARERLLLDGESERSTLAFRYGVAEDLELGFDLPMVAYNGGIFDGFIKQWHRFFGLPQGNRLSSPDDRLLFRYDRDGEERLRMENATFRMGDVRLNGAWQLYHDRSANPRALALRASVKLPTGSSSRLTGSGSTDLALWLTGSDDYQLPGKWGHATLFGAFGGMGLTDGDVLKGQQENLVGFGTVGGGWSPRDFIAFKVQFSGHTAFYKDSDLSELTSPAVQLLFGGTYAFTPSTTLDIALSEDIIVGASPDVALHLGLGQRF